MVLRWGIVTAGKICHDFVNAFNSNPNKSIDNVIVAVAARDEFRAKEFAQLHNIKHVFDSYQSMAISKEIGKYTTRISIFFLFILAFF